MKIVLFSLASILLISCTPSSALDCYKCNKDGKCEGEGTSESCDADQSPNCYYTQIGDSDKIKGCIGDKKPTEKPEMKGLNDLKPNNKMKWDGCFDITKQENNEQAYKICYCSSKECNVNDAIKSDMVTSTGDEGERKCHVCGDLSNKSPCKEDEIKDSEKTSKACGKKEGNCFLVESKRTKTVEGKDKTVSEVYKGCMATDSEETYAYGSLKFEDKDKFEGNYYVCNKNECNYDQKSWSESSVLGLSSSFVLIFTGLVSYLMLN